MTHEESWNAFIDELRTYVQEHHHFPNKHTNLLSRVKYGRNPKLDFMVFLTRRYLVTSAEIANFTYLLGELYYV